MFAVTTSLTPLATLTAHKVTRTAHEVMSTTHAQHSHNHVQHSHSIHKVAHHTSHHPLSQSHARRTAQTHDITSCILFELWFTTVEPSSFTLWFAIVELSPFVLWFATVLPSPFMEGHSMRMPPLKPKRGECLSVNLLRGISREKAQGQLAIFGWIGLFYSQYLKSLPFSLHTSVFAFFFFLMDVSYLSLRLKRHFFLLPLGLRIRQILL